MGGVVFVHLIDVLVVFAAAHVLGRQHSGQVSQVLIGGVRAAGFRQQAAPDVVRPEHVLVDPALAKELNVGNIDYVFRLDATAGVAALFDFADDRAGLLARD